MWVKPHSDPKTHTCVSLLETSSFLGYRKSLLKVAMASWHPGKEDLFCLFPHQHLLLQLDSYLNYPDFPKGSVYKSLLLSGVGLKWGVGGE